MHREFRLKRRVAFSETDLAGVMHFSNYYRWMEDVEHAFWRSLGESIVTPPTAGEAHPVSWPRVKTSCEYAGPAHFEDEIELCFRVRAVGEKSYTFEVEFLKGSARIARAETTAVCCTMRGGRFASTPIPADVRRKLEQSVG
jgi:YbgC/YbaW family acyl-CoA thioester hydrolase